MVGYPVELRLVTDQMAVMGNLGSPVELMLVTDQMAVMANLGLPVELKSATDQMVVRANLEPVLCNSLFAQIVSVELVDAHLAVLAQEAQAVVALGEVV